MVDRIERNKDLVQELVESTATHVGQIATIITGAVAGVAREIGDLVTDGFEMRDAARKARQDEERGILDVDEEDILEGGDAVEDDEIGDPVDLGELPASEPAALAGADDVPEEPVDVGELPGEQP
ncbi:hypothetical protein [Gordonia sp. SL306]|uniref:hypothetical protein n=1 Tax=Gordonia sp. SL306 TaxID=2995145 RepID=UPI0022717F36|nr:hypothetical protein [Gordonia sp. SL306]WAC54608.1 hypothetical protein OVA31_18370 [Gordonia sp. SL306]